MNVLFITIIIIAVFPRLLYFFLKSDFNEIEIRISPSWLMLNVLMNVLLMHCVYSTNKALPSLTSFVMKELMREINSCILCNSHGMHLRVGAR